MPAEEHTPAEETFEGQPTGSEAQDEGQRAFSGEGPGGHVEHPREGQEGRAPQPARPCFDTSEGRRVVSSVSQACCRGGCNITVIVLDSAGG